MENLNTCENDKEHRTRISAAIFHTVQVLNSNFTATKLKEITFYFSISFNSPLFGYVFILEEFGSEAFLLDNVMLSGSL